jgi:hypothetical protein
MKRLPAVLSSLALIAFATLALLASAPAPPAQAAQAGAQGLESRVAALEGELALEKKRHDETRALLDQTLVYLEKQGKAAQALLAVLDESEQQGFAVGENWRSRQTLLGGMRAYWTEQQAGAPKAPAPAPAKPATPARPPRVREE